MSHIPGRRLSRVLAVFLILTFGLTSCSSWQRIQPLSESTVQNEHYTQLRLWTVGGDIRMLRNPWFSGDTLYGLNTILARQLRVSYEKGDSVAIPIEKIAKVEAWRHDGSMTTGLA